MQVLYPKHVIMNVTNYTASKAITGRSKKAVKNENFIVNSDQGIRVSPQLTNFNQLAVKVVYGISLSNTHS